MVLTLYIDTITIICCVSLIVLFFISMFCNPFLRGRRLKKSALRAADVEVDTTDASATPISIVIPILEDAPELASTVETVLQQEYAAPFRVILVADRGKLWLNVCRPNTNKTSTCIVPSCPILRAI